MRVYSVSHCVASSYQKQSIDLILNIGKPISGLDTLHCPEEIRSKDANLMTRHI